MSEVNVSAERFNNLKARLKEIFKNRHYYGAISKFEDDSYDFTVSPATGDIILSDQGSKVIDLILSINDINDIQKIANDTYILRDITAIEALVSKLEGQTPTTQNNLCRGGCMGICIDHCSTACVGNCNTSCTDNNCAAGCTGECVHSCSSCSGNCAGSGCRSDCRTNCTGGLRN